MLKLFETGLKVGALKLIEFNMRREKLEAALLLHAPKTSLIPRPSHCPFLFTSTFYLLEAVKNWMMGRLILTSYLLLRPNSTLEWLRQIVIAQLYRHEARSAAMHIACAPKPHWSQFQTTSRKWFTNRFLNRFSAFILGVSKPVQQEPDWEPA